MHNLKYLTVNPGGEILSVLIKNLMNLQPPLAIFP